jgi:hypothetical protein
MRDTSAPLSLVTAMVVCAGKIQRVRAEQPGVAARQRGGRRIGGIGIGLVVERQRGLLRQIAQGLVQTRQHGIAHFDHALQRAARQMRIQRAGRADQLAGRGIDVLDRDVAVRAVLRPAGIGQLGIGVRHQIDAVGGGDIDAAIAIRAWRGST